MDFEAFAAVCFDAFGSCLAGLRMAQSLGSEPCAWAMEALPKLPQLKQQVLLGSHKSGPRLRLEACFKFGTNALRRPWAT